MDHAALRPVFLRDAKLATMRAVPQALGWSLMRCWRGAEVRLHSCDTSSGVPKHKPEGGGEQIFGPPKSL